MAAKGDACSTLLARRNWGGDHSESSSRVAARERLRKAAVGVGAAACAAVLIGAAGIASCPRQESRAVSSVAGVGSSHSRAGADEPTRWHDFYNSPQCQAQLQVEQAYMRAARRRSGFYCKGRPILYSAVQKFAYIKTPKAASIAIQELFQKQFPDAVWVTTGDELPAGTFAFTFVREPISRVISAFAEIDVTYARRATAEKRSSMNTTFHRLSRATDLNVRFLAFLDDLADHRFGGDDRDHWAPTHGYPQLNFACKQSLDFIGHLENQDTDWKEIQTMVGVPRGKQTLIPRVHEASKENCQAGRPCHEKIVNKNVSRTRQLLYRVCDLYRSDFSCLGYRMPESCLRRPEATARPTTATENKQTVPGRATGAAAPLHTVSFNADDPASRFRWMVQQEEYRNSLFIFSDSVENHTSHRASPGKDPTGLGGNGDASLRPWNRYGWMRKQPQRGLQQLVAPLSAGLPTCAHGRGFSALSAQVRQHIDLAFGEIVQLLLVHAYDRVIFSRELFATGGTALSRYGVGDPVVAYLQKRVEELGEPVRMVKTGDVAAG